MCTFFSHFRAVNQPLSRHSRATLGTFFFLAFITLLFLGATPVWGTDIPGTFEKITSTEALVDGYYVIVGSKDADNNPDYAMGARVTNPNSTAASTTNPVIGKRVSITDGTTISNPEDSLVYHIIISESGIALQNVATSKYLYQYNTSANRLNFQSEATNIFCLDPAPIYQTKKPEGFGLTTNFESSTSIYFKYLSSSTNFANAGTANWNSTTNTPVRLFKLTSQFTVSFNPEGGSCATASLTEASPLSGIVLPAASPGNACAAEGWTFVGWAAATCAETTDILSLYAAGLYAAGETYHPSSNCTLHAIYKKGELLTIDFENTIETYTDWTIVNATSQQTNASVTPQKGNYFGTTGGKKTASLTTKNTLSTPKVIRFYVTRQTTNDTDSKWYVDVSNNGSDWTQVTEQSAISMAVGTWIEVSQEISTYSNVYVRIRYDGGTATRNIDNILLSEATFSSNPSCTPVVIPISGEGETPEAKSWDAAFSTAPSMYDGVQLSNVAMTIPAGTIARAKQIVLASSASLTIEPGAALIVAENITREDDEPTTAEDLHIQSSSAGNGALIWGTTGTPGDATVDFYTKSHGTKGSSASVNQYIGTPFSNTPTVVSQYNNAWVYDATTDGLGNLYWKKMEANDLLNAWEGYNLITAEDAGFVYQLQGTLVSNADVTLSGSSTPALYNNGLGASNVNNENLLANSWVAPIRIAAFDAASDFSGVEATIYIFNAGSPEQAASAGVGEPGNYTAYSVGTAGDDDVIPSMQSFSVYTTGGDPRLTLNYNQLVKAPALASFVNAPNRAPRRTNTVAAEMEKLQLRVEGEKGWADELKIYTHPDFSTSFENGWDAHKLYGYPQAPQLYARTEDGDMAIHCVPEINAIRLGFQSGSEDDTYTFSFDYHGSEPLYLIDCQPEDATQESVSTLITADSRYTFHPGAPAEQERFLISSAPKMPTGSVSPEADQLRAKPRKLLHNGQLLILRDGKSYTVTGQKL